MINNRQQFKCSSSSSSNTLINPSTEEKHTAQMNVLARKPNKTSAIKAELRLVTQASHGRVQKAFLARAIPNRNQAFLEGF